MDPLFLFIELLFVLCSLILYNHHLRSKKTSSAVPIEWPILGHLPGMIANIHHFHDWSTGFLAGVGCNFEGRLGWTGLRYFITCDPANVRHVFTSNFANYPKGEEFATTFDILGGGILSADGESWRRQRVKVQMLMADPRFRALTAGCSHDEVETSLLPFLALAADEGRLCDLVDVFLRITFDVACTLICGVDPGCLVTGLPVVPFLRATDDALETLFLRHIIPMPCWKLMRRLNVGPERKMAIARRTIDNFIADTIAARRAAILNEGATDSADLLSSILCQENNSANDIMAGEFVHDTTLGLLVAGRDGMAAALSWFFYLVLTNPRVEKKLLDELSLVVASKKDGAGSAAVDSSSGGMETFHASEIKSLVYLHAAMCETLRLYPPIPFEFKTAAAADVLPCGKVLKAGDKVLFFNYAMSRMEGVWGKDCTEFRPERWITEEGSLRYEPSYKFFSFNTGPRTCLGKDMAFVLTKTVAAAMLWNFAFEVVPGHVVEPKLSIILHMKNGLLVRVRRRSRTMSHVVTAKT
ncbi:hypothetical protein U9M48_006067 [Paspalum notatum var. saurae]|uniref:Cytochrome P450 n=1 Tax=Paspalum notatum var. saurae TaxID=547442 RepID=A0AAQ3PNQ0_PASNO